MAQSAHESDEAAEGAASASDNSTPNRLTIALAWVAARQARGRIFDHALFANPAWDVLLDLFISHAHGKEACVTNVCVASSAPETTVLRWISVLEQRAMIERSRDPKDRRRTLLRLSHLGLSKMERALDASAESDARLGLGRLRIVNADGPLVSR